MFLHLKNIVSKYMNGKLPEMGKNPLLSKFSIPLSITDKGDRKSARLWKT